MIEHFFLTARSGLFYLGYSIALIIHASLCVLLGWLMPFRARFRFCMFWNGFALWWLKVTCGVRCRISGIENIPDGSFVLLSNHQSPWETIFLYHQFQPICAVLKRELLSIPFFGWALRLLKPIAIDRSKRTQARQLLLSEGKERLAEGISVLVFPEGTRVALGEDRKFSSGGAELAITAEARILPLAHNAGAFWPAHRFVKTPGTIDVVIGKPIDATGRDPRELTDEVKTWMRQAFVEKA